MDTYSLNLKFIMHLKKTATADSRLWLIHCPFLNFVEPLIKKEQVKKLFAKSLLSGVS